MELEILSVKRKRTQRQRPCGNSFSSSNDGLPLLVATTPEELVMPSLSTEEEEHEVAKCLIFLAQGEYQTDEDSFSPIKMRKGRNSILDKKSDGVGGVFECKICNRLFHSFQALGGHRTSHKKLKIDTNSDEPRLQLINSRATEKIRVHQCLICCVEFPSGQALGGHMRKHRVYFPVQSPIHTHSFTNETKAVDALSMTLSISSHAQVEAGIETSRSNSEFQFLDLNLPVSSEEGAISATRYSFASKQHRKILQDSSLVLSGSVALVDSHYG